MADPDRPSSSPRPFKYYCELLTNIQQVSISISSSPSPSTTASLHPSKRAILLSQQSSPCPLPIFLPARVSPKQPLTASQSYRLPTLHSYTEEPDAKTAPLSASSFSTSSSSSSSPSSIHCNSCAAELIPSDRIQEWKDLPNENWADLMDFWHCHKPHDDPPMNGEEEGEKEEGHASHHGHKDEAKKTTTTTGAKYAKYGNVAAKKGVGLVEMMFLLVDRSDCNDGSIQMTQTTTTTPSKQSFTPIHCTSCTSPLGVFDNKSTGYRLMKWSLCIRYIPSSSSSSSSSSSPHEPYFKSYDTQQWVSSHLVYLADSQGSRKFTIQHDDDDDNDNNKKKSFRIWLFNPYTVVTTHVYRIPTDAVKVYYRCDITPTTPTTTTTTTINGEKDKEGGKGGGGGKVGVDGTALQDPETVYLPGRVYDVIWSILEGNNREMPEELQVWGEWRTSWMKRFGQGES